MNCGQVQQRILEFEPADAIVSEHIAGCEICQHFLAVQRSLDQQLARAYVAPAVHSRVRVSIRAGIRTEKRRRVRDLLAELIAPFAGLATSGICALLAPQHAGILLAAGLGLSAVGYMGQLLFTWLTEELGEG